MDSSPESSLPDLPCYAFDIDGTLTRYRDFHPEAFLLGNFLFPVLRDLAVERGMASAEAERRIAAVLEANTFWDYPDFVRALDLPAGEALERMRAWHRDHIEPCPDAVALARRLHAEGKRLFVVSNNPRLGCLLKLERCGLADAAAGESAVFERIAGTDAVFGCKGAPGVWPRALALFGVPPADVCVVGDNPKEDRDLALAAGAGNAFLFDRSSILRGVESTAQAAPPPAPLLSVVIPTRNEARNIQACIECFREARDEGWCEALVVDNSSDDGTPGLAAACGVPVFTQGPERSAQRNRGWAKAKGRYVCFMDADMRMPAATLAEIRSRLLAPDPPEALWIREVRVGTGWWIKVRNFERSFYDATCIDALRVFSKALLEKTGGYDPAITGFEDWDLDRRVLNLGVPVGLTDHALLHDEGKFSWRRHLKKKSYYSGFTDVYRDKWHNDAVIRKQLGVGYRFFGVFLERGKWKRALRHPLWMASIYFERVLVGFCLVARKRRG